MKHVLSYSGGKDSTATLILVKKYDIPLDEIIYVDVGKWMWSEVEEHLNKVEEYIDMPITYLDISEEIQKGFNKWGFPSPLIRWCTGLKKKYINKHTKKYLKEGLVQYIGIAKDESHRMDNIRSRKNETFVSPLIEYNITEDIALKMCYDEGFDFGGVYKHHSRFNCWCCPLQTLDELRVLFLCFQDYWEQLRKMQWMSSNDFRQDTTIMSLEHRWWMEMRNPKKRKLWSKFEEFNEEKK